MAEGLLTPEQYAAVSAQLPPGGLESYNAYERLAFEVSGAQVHQAQADTPLHRMPLVFLSLPTLELPPDWRSEAIHVLKRLYQAAQQVAPPPGAAAARPPRPTRLLELGTGAGDVALLLARLVGPRGEVIGMERDPAMIETAQARVADAGNVRALEGDVAHLDGLDGPFDAVVGRLILLYVDDPAAALRSVANGQAGLPDPQLRMETPIGCANVASMLAGVVATLAPVMRGSASVPTARSTRPS